MNKWQRILCTVLSVILLLVWMPASLAEEPAETEPAEAEEKIYPDELIVGHPTITKGDFFTEMFGNNTSDIDVRALIHGYNLVNWDQNQGTYVFDPSVVRKVVSSFDNNGNHRFNLVLAQNLYYSDGTQITAWDYAFSLLLMMSPEIEQIGGKIYRAEHILGYDDYIAARRKVMAGETLDPNNDIPYLSGVRVLDDFQIEFTLDATYLPDFFEIGLMMTVPYPISVIAPGCKVTHGIIDTEGNMLGIKIVNEDGSEATNYTAELLKQTILDPEKGYNTLPSVVSGPYEIKSWDGVTGHFEINTYFKGAWIENTLPGEDGERVENAELVRARAADKIVVDKDENGVDILYNGEPLELVKPTIDKIALTVADNDTLAEDLEAGKLHLVNKVTYKDAVEEARALEDIRQQSYPRIGLAFLTFDFDSVKVNDMDVRQAIAWCMDRDALTEAYCGDNGIRMDGYFGFEQWEYKILEGRLDAPVNFLPDIDALGTEITEEQQQEYDRKKNLHYMYYSTDEEKELLLELWDNLRKKWKWTEGDEEKTLLTKYEVNLDNANALLDKAGWTLNREGNTYTPGTDDVRCKEIDGQIIPLELSVMYPQGNHMAEFMQKEGNFSTNLEQVGIKIEFVPAPMEELLLSYYRETPRTTDMIYLATNFHVIVDPSITYSMDDTVGHQVWNNTYSDDEKLWNAAVNMRKTEPGDYYTYVDKWMTFQERYNTVLPTIPIYSNIYFDFYVPELQNYNIVKNVTWSQAILAAFFGEDEEPVVPEADEPADDGTMSFGD